MPTRPSAVRRPTHPVVPARGSPMPAPLTQHPPPLVATRGWRFVACPLHRPQTSPQRWELIITPPEVPANPHGGKGEKTLTDTRFDWKKNMTHLFLCCLRSLCSILCASPMVRKAVACVVRVLRVMYVPVSVPSNVPLEAIQPVFRVFCVYCVSHHCHHHHFSAL